MPIGSASHRLGVERDGLPAVGEEHLLLNTGHVVLSYGDRPAVRVWNEPLSDQRTTIARQVATGRTRL